MLANNPCNELMTSSYTLAMPDLNEEEIDYVKMPMIKQGQETGA